MANRTYNQFAGTLERKVVKLFAKILYTGGAPTLVLSEVLNSSTSPITINPSQGFESLSPESNGQFTLVLGSNNGGVPTYDPYVRLLNVSACVDYTSGTVATLPVPSLLSVQVVTDNVNGASGNPSITLVTQIIDGSANPAVGVLPNDSVLYVELTLSNTTAY